MEANDLILFFIILVGNSLKVYTGGKGLLTWSWWGYIVWFTLLSWAISALIQSQFLLSYFMDHYSSIIILALITLLVGFYTGLQLKEIIRFRKLIWAKMTNKNIRNKQ